MPNTETGYTHDWEAKPAAPTTDEERTQRGHQQLTDWLEQGFRNHPRGMHLAGHPALNDAVTKHAADLDLSKGPEGANAWFDKIADTLEAPESAGMDGLLGDLLATQRKMGLID